MTSTPVFDITPAIATLDAMSDRYVQSPALMQRAYKRGMTRLAQRTVAALRPEPASGNTIGITRLMTPRQRRFVHALRAARGGGDYIRTHGISQGWEYDVQALADGGSVTVFNDAPGATYVEGWDQQSFLAALGWLYAPPILAEFSEEADFVAEQTWITITDPTAGVPV